MARSSPTISPLSTISSFWVALFAWLFGLLLTGAVMGLIIIAMARTKIPNVEKEGSSTARGRGGRSRGGRTGGRRGGRRGKSTIQEESSETAEEYEEETESGSRSEEEEEEEQEPQPSQPQPQPKSQKARDKETRWREDMHKRSITNERQVHVASLSADFPGMSAIRDRGMGFWFEPLHGYSRLAVVEFYANMLIKLKASDRTKDEITSKVGGKSVRVTADRIAFYLRYRRPENYVVEPEFAEGQTAVDIVYENPAEVVDRYEAGSLKEQFRLINLAIHANLIPRHAAQRLSPRTLDVMCLFSQTHLPMDCAQWIFDELVYFKAESTATTNMPFPCMITTLCYADGVEEDIYRRLEPLSPGPITRQGMRKSEAQSRPRRVARRARPNVEPPVVPIVQEQAGPSGTSSRVRSSIKSLLKRVLCQNVDIQNTQRRMERDNRRAVHRMEWLTGQVQEMRGTEYVPPPEEPLEEIEAPVMSDSEE